MRVAVGLALVLVYGGVLSMPRAVKADDLDFDVKGMKNLKKLIRKYKPRLDPRSGDIDLSRPGTCPPKSEVSELSPNACSFVCLFDLGCPGTQRCCQDDCGGTACVETTENTAEVTLGPEVVEPTAEPTAAKTTPGNPEADVTLGPEFVEPTAEPTAARTTPGNTEVQTTLAQQVGKTSPEPTFGPEVVTEPKPTMPVAGTTHAATSASKTEASADLYLDGDAMVNITAVEGANMVLRCNITSPATDETLLYFWMVKVGNAYMPWSAFQPTGNKRVSHSGAWLEFEGVALEDARVFVCFGGHATGYLTQMYALTVTEDLGENIKVTPNPCVGELDVCQNNGTCVPLEDGNFTCQCTDGWEGQTCHERASPCASAPCLNGGNCTTVATETFQCACPSGFTGSRCEEVAVVTTAEPPAELITQPMMSEACYLPKKSGRCARKISQWYYDVETERCQPFVYSGCQGNANRFRSYIDCQWECPRLPRDPCSHPIVTGRCKARIPRWAYSAERKECVEFVYGGCGATGNNFLTWEECSQTCIRVTEAPCTCQTPSLPFALCFSEFAITGIVRRQSYSGRRLRSVVVDVTRAYTGQGVAPLGSRLFDRRHRPWRGEQRVILTIQGPTDMRSRCQTECFDELENGKEYIFTGSLTREGGRQNRSAFLTSRSYVRRATGKRMEKLERIAADRNGYHRNCRDLYRAISA